MTFTKESFIQLVDVLREQYDKDCAYAHKMGELLNSAEIPTYNWDSVNRFLVSQIQKQFPPSKEGECEFERYCFELNFGRDLDGNVVFTPEMLWDKMYANNFIKINWKILKYLKIPSTHQLIDDIDDLSVHNIIVNDAEVLSPSKNQVNN